ncbi:diguanylate cyclase [Vreelandella aquamarina]|uniref:sensor domain-containing diguanylate cyclase n=1 Tax=Vreelandella aquamarina TaxID=77097 RepID=UPI00384D9C39
MGILNIVSRYRLGWVAACMLWLAAPGDGQADDIPQPLFGWEYRWGDSPLDEKGAPIWLQEESGWHSVTSPSNPPGRAGQQTVWLRTVLPEGNWHDPVLHITSINLVGQIYLGDTLIYEHGSVDHPRFIGWPWHLVTLPAGFAGKQLSLRIFSDYTSIGLWGNVQVIERVEALKQILQESVQDLAVSAFSLLLATLAAIFAIIGPDRRGFGSIALFAFATGTMLLAETPVRQLLTDVPLAWDMLRAASYFTLPVAMALLLSHWLEGSPKKWMARLWQIHLVYMVTAMGLVYLELMSLVLAFPIFDALLLITLPCMLLLALSQLRRLQLEQRLFVFGFLLFAPLIIADMLVAHGLIPQRDRDIPLSYATLGFLLVIVAISLWHYRHTQQQLASVNHTLEAQVAARTAQLDCLVEQLKGLAIQDALTGLHNRRHFDTLLNQEVSRAQRTGHPLSLLMIDIDHFKKVNDCYGHDVGDAVLVEVAALLRQHFRGSDTVCRLGGEEFVALLPETETVNAEARAQSLMAELRVKPLSYHQKPLGFITLSCGVATYPNHTKDPNKLLKLADEALYKAKNSGRDRCMVCECHSAIHSS